MNSEELHHGYVIMYDLRKSFGFIEMKNKETIFFVFEKEKHLELLRSGAIDKIHVYKVGDEVTFKIRESAKKDGKLEAYEVTYIQNIQEQLFREDITGKEVLRGFLRKIDTRYIIKYETLHYIIPVKIAGWETNLKENYENRLKRLVQFTLVQAPDGKEEAQLVDRVMDDCYYQLAEMVKTGEATRGSISGSNPKGYFVKVMKRKVTGFIPIAKSEIAADPEILNRYRKGDQVNVKVRHLYENRSVAFMFAD